MSSSPTPLPVQAVPVLPEPAMAHQPFGPPGPHPARRIHMLLRGRYHWAALLSLVGLVLGGFTGHSIIRDVFTSSGMLRIEPSVPAVLSNTDQNGVMPMFDSFVRAQAVVMRSPRCIQVALESPTWKATQRGSTAEVIQNFNNNLRVVEDPRSQVIAVWFSDPNPAVAVAAVRSIIEAYMDLYKEYDATNESGRLTILQDRINIKTRDYETLNRKINDIAEEFGGVVDLQPQITDTLNQLQTLEADLRQVNLAIEIASENKQPQPDIQDAPDPLEIAAVDPVMRDYLSRKRTLEQLIVDSTARYGPKHRLVLDRQRQLDGLNSIIQRYAHEYARMGPAGSASSSNAAAAGLAGLSPERLATRRDNLTQQIQQLRAQKNNLGEKSAQLRDLQQKAQNAWQDLDSTRKRFEILNTESQVSGRVTPISKGETPFEPSNSGKRKQLALLGGVGGGSFGLGIILLWGLFDRRLQTSDDLRLSVHKTRMLGILPLLPDDLTDPDQASSAAFAVHHIRTMLQVGPSRGRDRIFAVTSPAPGTGKTSLTFALGLSFAHSGAKTLLIDADIVGAGLTARSEAAVHPKLGQVLLNAGYVTPEQIEMALAQSAKDGRRIGETLVAQGAITEEQLKQALALQPQKLLGLLDVLQKRAALEDCIKAMAMPGLSILPVGGAQIHQAASISPHALDELIQQARAKFDIVLFDTGPILGSLEASAVAALVDGVVLTVSRGEQRPLAERAAEHLRSVGAIVAGLVFNRADEQDVVRSSYASLHSTRVLGSVRGQAAAIQASHSRHRPQPRWLGPIATAVAVDADSPDTAPGSGNDNGDHGANL